MTEEARQRVRDAQARVKAASSGIASRRSTWADLDAADQDLKAAERDLARVTGDEYAVVLDLGMAWDTGAPLPHVLAAGLKAYVLFYLKDTDPDWDGTWTRLVEPGSAEPEPLGVIEFKMVHSIKIGKPNDEAIEGHPLYGKGLEVYGAHHVVNSRWITDAERMNSVHHNHRGGWHDRLTHYVFCFHDETLECLAEGIATERYLASPRDVLSDLVNRLLR